MNELIKITTNEHNDPTVSGRELHAFLDVKTPYHKWFLRMVEYGFEEGKDYEILVGQKCPSNNPKNPIAVFTDYTLSMDMAKEISMLQRSAKGKEARQYFIACERRLRLVAQFGIPQQDVQQMYQMLEQLIGIVDRLTSSLPPVRKNKKTSDEEKRMEDSFDPLSLVKEFIHEKCVIHPNLWTSTSELWNVWKIWCNIKNAFEGEKGVFFRKLKTLAPKITRSRIMNHCIRSYGYNGIGIRS